MLNELASEEKQDKCPNLVVNDVKGSLASKLDKPLKNNHYNVKIFNLLEPTLSDDYNPLAIIVRNVLNNSLDTARSYSCHLAQQLFVTSNKTKHETGENKYYAPSQFINLFNATVFALMAIAQSRYHGLDDYKQFKGLNLHEDGTSSDNDNISKTYVAHSRKNAWDYVTLSNIYNLVNELNTPLTSFNGHINASQLTIFFRHLKDISKKLAKKHSNSKSVKLLINLLKRAYSEFSEATNTGMTHMSIEENFVNTLKPYASVIMLNRSPLDSFKFESLFYDGILKIKINPKYLGQKVAIRLHSYDNDAKEFYKTKITSNCLVNVPVKYSLKNESFKAKVTVHSNKSGKSLSSKIYIYNTNYFDKKDVTWSCNHYIISSCNYMCSKNPLAIFWAVPSNQSDLNNIASIFITQMSQYALNFAKIGLHPQNDVDVILDNLNVLPRIVHFAMYMGNLPSQHTNFLFSMPSLKTFKNMYSDTSAFNMLNGNYKELILHEAKGFLVATNKYIFNYTLALMYSTSPKLTIPFDLIPNDVNVNLSDDLKNNQINFKDLYAYLEAVKHLDKNEKNYKSSLNLINHKIEYLKVQRIKLINKNKNK